MSDGIITGYPIGSDISLLNTIYRYPQKQENGKYSKDFIDIIYKDNMSGKKNHELIETPDYEFYKAKDEILIDHNLFFIESEKVEKISTPYNKLEKTIAEMTGNTDFYYNNLKSGNRYANRQLHTLENIFNSDINIEDHYRFRFSNLYQNNIMNISKAYFDIEVDTIRMKGDFPELGECPVNAISYIDDQKQMIYVYLLRNNENPLIQQFEQSISKELFDELKEFIIENVGGPIKAKKFKLTDLNFEFRFYDEEIKLIQDFFITVNKNEPDFLLAWNMAFDIPYIIERLKVLGYDPAEIIAHPDFPNKIAEYFIDERHRNEYEARGDEYTITAYTVFLDQLIHFASRRKGQSSFPNFKLDTAGEIIAGVHKLDYSHITTSIALLPYKNFKVFTFYNIMDTIVQKCIETKVGDIDYIYGKCNLNNTRYSKGHRQTVYLSNRGVKEFYKDGYIMGNNNNRNNSKEDFPGALVGDPLHNSNYAKLKQNGEVLNIVDNTDDFDFKSLYPSITRELNMAPNTQIGKIKIPDKVYKNENPFNFEFYDRGGQFIEDLISGNILEFSHRWMHLADYREWLEDLTEYFTMCQIPTRQIVTVKNDLFKPVNYYPNIKENIVRPVYYGYERPVSYVPTELNMNQYLEQINRY